MAYQFGIANTKGSWICKENCCELFVTCDPEDFNDELGVYDDNIGHHCPEIKRVLGPIGMDYEDMECTFIKSWRELGKTLEEMKDYLESKGWIYNKSLDPEIENED